MSFEERPLHSLLEDAATGTWGAPADSATDGFPVLRSTNIHKGTLVLDDVALRAVSDEAAVRFALRDGDILVTTSSGSSELIGKNCLFHQPPDDRTYLFSNFTLRLRPDQSQIVPAYLYYYLNSGRAKDELKGIHNTTSGLRNLNTTLYLDQPVPLAPLPQQRHIVELLDRADDLRRKRAETDRLASHIVQALFRKMFGDPITNPMKWPAGSIGDVTLRTQYGTSKPANREGKGVLVIRMNNITADGYLDLSELKHVELEEEEVGKYLLHEGDLLFNRTNSIDLVGKTGLWDSSVEAVAASYIVRVELDRTKAVPAYVWAWMNMPSTRKAMMAQARRAVGMANLNAEELRALPLLLPDLVSQEEFSAYLGRLLVARSRARQAQAVVGTLFEVIVRRAFSGSLAAGTRVPETEH